MSIYVHIPFCKSKCHYCNFVSYCNQNDKMEDYVSSVVEEIKLQGKQYGSTRKISSIYIGGGSPSVLKDGMIAKIMTQIKNSFSLLPNCEISIEVNPGSVTEKKLMEYKLVGFNRLSIGGQTLNQKILDLLGRNHLVAHTKEAIKLAKLVGFKNINVDMILALPTQKISDIKNMAKFLIKQKIPHISAYSLILEEGTPLYKSVKQGKVKLPSEDESVEMYNTVYNILKKHGYVRYEVSNFSYPDYESKHNQNYWQMGEYLAIGLAGHSFVNNTRTANTDNIDEYIEKIKDKKIPIVSKENISPSQRKDETIMLALRTNEGLDLKEFANQFNTNLLVTKKREIEFLQSHNFISVKNGYLKVADNAFYVLNSIIAKLV